MEAVDLELIKAYILKARSAPASRQIRDPFEALYSTGQAIEPPLPLERLLVLAEENAIHASCLRAKADDSVGRGWKIIGKDSEIADEINERLASLCPEWTFSELLWQAAYEMEACGWAAWEIVRQGGAIVAIYPLPGHTLRATPDPSRYLQMRGAEVREFAAWGHGDDEVSEVILFRAYSPRSSYYGIPRWVAAIPAIVEFSAIREYNISFFSSGGVIDRLISITSSNMAEAAALREQIRDQIKNATGHSTILVSASDATQVRVDFLSPAVGRRDRQFGGGYEHIIREILVAHAVPPYRIGYAEIGSLGSSAAKEMLRAYRMGVIEPIQTVLEARLNQTLFGPDGLAIEGKWRLNDLDYEETELNLAIATNAVERGILTPNEAREMLGREPVEDKALDIHYVTRPLRPLKLAVEDELTYRGHKDEVAQRFEDLLFGKDHEDSGDTEQSQ